MKCCICGTVRNCEKFLDKIFKNMELIGSIFEDYVIMLYYDVSTDNTLNKMKEYQKKNSKFLFYVNTGKLSQYRTFRLANGRNFCINFIKNNYPDYEYFIVMDCDNVCAKNMNVNLLKHYLNRNDWDSLSFNHPDGYYDCWALSIYPYIADCYLYNNSWNSGAKKVETLSKIINKKKLIQCSSAFNGFAIYRTNKFINCSYSGRLNLGVIPPKLLAKNIKSVNGFSKNNLINDYEDCEHRYFHFEAIKKNNARIRISPLCLFSNT